MASTRKSIYINRLYSFIIAAFLEWFLIIQTRNIILNSNQTFTANINDYIVPKYSISGNWDIYNKQLRLIQDNKVYLIKFVQALNIHYPAILTIIDSNGSKVIKTLDIQNFG